MARPPAASRKRRMRIEACKAMENLGAALRMFMQVPRGVEAVQLDDAIRHANWQTAFIRQEFGIAVESVVKEERTPVLDDGVPSNGKGIGSSGTDGVSAAAAVPVA